MFSHFKLLAVDLVISDSFETLYLARASKIVRGFKIDVPFELRGDVFSLQMLLEKYIICRVMQNALSYSFESMKFVARLA